MKLLLVFCALLYSVSGDGHGASSLTCSYCVQYEITEPMDTSQSSELVKAFMGGIQGAFATGGQTMDPTCKTGGMSRPSIPCSTYCIAGGSSDVYSFPGGESVKFWYFGRWCANATNTDGLNGGCGPSSYWEKVGYSTAAQTGSTYTVDKSNFCYCKDKNDCNNAMDKDPSPPLNAGVTLTYNTLIVTALVAVYRLLK